MASYDSVIAISGASSGIGLGVATHLAQLGAHLSLADVNLAGLLGKDAEPADLFKNCMTTTVDVRDARSVDRWIEHTVEHFGKLDGAVNCAGVLGHWAPVMNKSDEEWESVLDVNLGGTFRCLRAQLAHMSEGGSIVNLTSVSGMSGLPFNAPYCASKHGIIGLTRSAAKEVAAKKIRVNCVAPGTVETPMLMVGAGKSNEQLRKEISESTPMNRMGTVEEAANMIAFLLGPDSSYTTGAVFTMDGGMTA